MSADEDVAWINDGVGSGLSISASIPPIFAAYATLVFPPGLESSRDQMRPAEDRFDGALLRVLCAHTDAGGTTGGGVAAPTRPEGQPGERSRGLAHLCNSQSEGTSRGPAATSGGTQPKFPPVQARNGEVAAGAKAGSSRARLEHTQLRTPIAEDDEHWLRTPNSEGRRALVGGQCLRAPNRAW